MNEYRTNLDKRPDEGFLEHFGLNSDPIIFGEEESARYASRINPDIELEGHKNICLRKAAEMIGLDLRGKAALDIGCGEGRWSRFMSMRGAKVFGVDQSPTMIEIAKKRSDEMPIIYQPLDFEALLKLGHCFDIAIASYVFNNIPDLDKIFYVIKKIINDDGEIIIITKTFKTTNNNHELQQFKGLFLPIIINGKYHMYAAANSFDDYNVAAQRNDFELKDHFCGQAPDEIDNPNLQRMGIQIEDQVMKYGKTIK